MHGQCLSLALRDLRRLIIGFCAALQAYRNPQGPGNAVEGAAAVYAHESQEAGAMPAMVMPAAVGTSQSTAEQAGPDLGMPAVRVV